MDKNDIILALRQHKKNIAIYESLLNENNIFAPVQHISDMPKAMNKYTSVVEDYAFNDKELREVFKEIRRVDIWLCYLLEEEKFIIEQVFFEERYMSHIINKWINMGKEHHGESYWKNKKKEAIKKIARLNT